MPESRGRRTDRLETSCEGRSRDGRSRSWAAGPRPTSLPTWSRPSDAPKGVMFGEPDDESRTFGFALIRGTPAAKAAGVLAYVGQWWRLEAAAALLRLARWFGVHLIRYEPVALVSPLLPECGSLTLWLSCSRHPMGGDVRVIHGEVNELDEISIVPTTDDLIASLNRCLDAVARERRFIGLVEGTTLKQSEEFVRGLLEGGGVQLLTVDGTGSVVGWCDIRRPRLEGFRHCGILGMGLLPHVRGRGLGRRIAEAAIAAARERGVERIELEVFASNVVAIALYERLGFVREGAKASARKLDGRYDDVVLMAILLEPRIAQHRC